MEWQTIETAPVTGATIILTDGVHVTAGWWNSVTNSWQGGGTVDGWEEHPTHWMPLPDPPDRAGRSD